MWQGIQRGGVGGVTSNSRKGGASLERALPVVSSINRFWIKLTHTNCGLFSSVRHLASSLPRIPGTGGRVPSEELPSRGAPLCRAGADGGARLKAAQLGEDAGVNRTQVADVVVVSQKHDC